MRVFVFYSIDSFFLWSCDYEDEYRQEFIQKYSRKLAFLIDCVDGINIRALYPRFLDNFPLNSDIFLFLKKERKSNE